MSGTHVRFALRVAATAALSLACPAMAVEDGPQPFVGDPILDSTHDLPALQRTLGVSLAIQSGRHGLVVGFHLAAADRLTATWPDDRGAAVDRAVTAHRVGLGLALAALGVRGLAAAGAGNARTLSGGLHAFGVPFLVGAGIDGAAAVNALEAGARLRRWRLDAGLAGDRRAASLLSEWTLVASGVLSAISAVTQLLVGSAALDFALYESRRSPPSAPGDRGVGPEIRLSAGAGGVALRARF